MSQLQLSYLKLEKTMKTLTQATCFPRSTLSKKNICVLTLFLSSNVYIFSFLNAFSFDTEYFRRKACAKSLKLKGKDFNFTAEN